MTDLLQMVKIRLIMIGYKEQEYDTNIMQYALTKAQNFIKNYCNVKAIPMELDEVTADIACGEFLKLKKDSKSLNIDGMNLTAVTIKSISEGDTNVSLGSADGSTSDEQKIDSLISQLLNPDKEVLLCYRKMKW